MIFLIFSIFRKYHDIFQPRLRLRGFNLAIHLYYRLYTVSLVSSADVLYVCWFRGCAYGRPRRYRRQRGLDRWSVAMTTLTSSTCLWWWSQNMYGWWVIRLTQVFAPGQCVGRAVEFQSKFAVYRAYNFVNCVCYFTLNFVSLGFVYTSLLYYPIHHINLEWHYIAFLCRWAVKKLHTHSLTHLFSII